MELVFIRHGESEAIRLARQPGGFFCGRRDCGLSEEGRRQAEELKGNPEILGAEAVYCSPLKRAKETAGLLSDQPAIIDERLTERSLGIFEGKWQSELEENEEYRKYFTDERYAHLRASFTVRAPGGENLSDVVERVTPFLEELRKKDYRRVIIVSHAIAIKCMLKVVENLSEEEVLRLKVRPCEPVRAELK